jgi:hypothetical protein
MILIKLEQFLKVALLIIVSVVGSVILFKLVHPPKALAPTLVIVLGSVILVIISELLKPLLLTSVTL